MALYTRKTLTHHSSSELPAGERIVVSFIPPLPFRLLRASITDHCKIIHVFARGVAVPAYYDDNGVDLILHETSTQPTDTIELEVENPTDVATHFWAFVIGYVREGMEHTPGRVAYGRVCGSGPRAAIWTAMFGEFIPITSTLPHRPEVSCVGGVVISDEVYNVDLTRITPEQQTALKKWVVDYLHIPLAEIDNILEVLGMPIPATDINVDR